MKKNSIIIKRSTFKGRFPIQKPRLILNNGVFIQSNRNIALCVSSENKNLNLVSFKERLLFKRGNYKMGNGKSKFLKSVSQYPTGRIIYKLNNNNVKQNFIKCILEREIYNQFIKNSLLRLIKKNSFLKN